ncbi:MAG: hypothetical protein ABIR30_08780 [Chitinophagaceae bacterium]
MFIFYGKTKTMIDSIDVFMYECPYCEKNNTTILSVYSWYYHIFWIPFFPYLKEGYALCADCKTKRSELQFGPKLLSEYKEHSKKIRHPLWTWSISIILLLLILAIIIDASI